MRIDLHTHSSVSDGTDTPTQLVLKAQAQGVDVIALCDHDTFDGLLEAREASKRVGTTVVPGIEISTKVDGVTAHLLGYGCDPYHRPLLEELAKIRVGRSGRLQATVDALTAHGMPLTVDDVMAQAGAAPSIGRPHVADAMVAKGYVSHRDEAFAQWIGEGMPGYVERYAPSLEDAIDLVHGARGVAVIAHPWARESRHALTAERLAALVADHALDGIEVDHEDHSEADRELLFRMGERLGLIRTGSSDYHGLGKTNHELGSHTTRESAYLEIVRRIKVRAGVL